LFHRQCMEPGTIAGVCVAMKINLQELSERERAQAAEALMIPTAEFVALFAGAILLLGIVFGIVSPVLPIL
jgi:hypothetical protein